MNSLVNGVSVLIAAAAVVGCAGRSQAPPSLRTPTGPSITTGLSCNSGEQPVTINRVSIPASGTTATIQVNPGSRTISATGDGVRWQFSGNDYEFTSDGVTFNKPSNPSQPASGPISSGFGKDAGEYVVCFGDTTSLGKVTWAYNIKFYDKKTPATVWFCDPTIVNHGSGVVVTAALSVTCTLAP